MKARKDKNTKRKQDKFRVFVAKKFFIKFKEITIDELVKS